MLWSLLTMSPTNFFDFSNLEVDSPNIYQFTYLKTILYLPNNYCCAHTIVVCADFYSHEPYCDSFLISKITHFTFQQILLFIEFKLIYEY